MCHIHWSQHAGICVNSPRNQALMMKADTLTVVPNNAGALIAIPKQAGRVVTLLQRNDLITSHQFQDSSIQCLEKAASKSKYQRVWYTFNQLQISYYAVFVSFSGRSCRLSTLITLPLKTAQPYKTVIDLRVLFINNWKMSRAEHIWKGLRFNYSWI